MLYIKILLYITRYGNFNQETNHFSYKNIITTPTGNRRGDGAYAVRGVSALPKGEARGKILPGPFLFRILNH